MHTRLWGLVSLFAGIVVMLGVWLMMSANPSAVESEERAQVAARQNAGALGTVPAGVPIAPERLRLGVRDIAMRQERVTRIRANHTPSEPRGASESGTFALDQGGIAAAVEGRRTDLQSCYKTSSLHTPSLPSKMSLALSIEPESGQSWGRVVQVDSDAPGEVGVLESCMVTVLGGLRFEATEPVTIRYPIAFTVRDETE